MQPARVYINTHCWEGTKHPLSKHAINVAQQVDFIRGKA